MPRLKKTEAQRRAERFDDHYRTSKAHLKRKESDIAAALGIGVSTLRKYRRNPMGKKSFGIWHFLRLRDVLEWSDEDLLDIFGVKK